MGRRRSKPSGGSKDPTNDSGWKNRFWLFTVLAVLGLSLCCEEIFGLLGRREVAALAPSRPRGGESSVTSQEPPVDDKVTEAAGWTRLREYEAAMGLTECGIPRRDRLTLQEFEEEFYNRGRPVLFQSHPPNTETLRMLRRKELVSNFGPVPVSVDASGHYAHGGYTQKRESIQTYVNEILPFRRPDGSPVDLYSFDSSSGDFLQQCEAHAGFHPFSDYQPDTHFQVDAAWQNRSRSPPRLIIGNVMTGIAFHEHAGTFNALFYGFKRWGLYGPGKFPRQGYNPALPYLAWLKTVYPQLTEAERPMECVQQPGEILYIPDGWTHAVLNLGETVAAAFLRDGSRPGSAQYFYDKGMTAWRREANREKAFELLSRAHELDPTNAHYLNEMASLFSSNVSEQGVWWARKAVEVNPQMCIAHENLIGALMDVGRWQEAATAAAAAVGVPYLSADTACGIARLFAPLLRHIKESSGPEAAAALKRTLTEGGFGPAQPQP